MLLMISCSPARQVPGLKRSSNQSGSSFYEQNAGKGGQQRDSIALSELLSGNMPAFLLRFVPIKLETYDSILHNTIKAEIYVSPDYLSIGTDDDWARIPLMPATAQKLADTLHCFLPTRKIVDAIYKTARVKPEPVPLFSYRDSTVTMWHHHLIIEGQRKGKKGLIAGIKKDVVISGRIKRDARPNRVAIYGWHRMNGTPIQPLYTGHIDQYVDYSHGIRLVYRKIKVNGKWMDYQAVLADPVLRQLICDEDYCDFYRYDY